MVSYVLGTICSTIITLFRCIPIQIRVYLVYPKTILEFFVIASIKYLDGATSSYEGVFFQSKFQILIASYIISIYFINLEINTYPMRSNIEAL